MANKKEKTVGEILEEEYAKQLGKENAKEVEEEVKPKEEAKESKIKFEQEVDLRQIVMGIEKLTAELSTLKEIRFHDDERIKELAESIGELRSLLFQRDATIKETEAKVDKLEEIISEIKPEKIASQLRKREAGIDENLARIEKLERMSKDLLDQIRKSQKILENIKSMENLVEITKDIESKLEKIEELKSGTEREAGKTERIYLEMGRRFSEFSALKEKTTKTEELSKELVKSLDEVKIKLENRVSKEDMQAALEDALKPPELGAGVEELNKRKSEILSLLKNLGDQFRQGLISKESYDEVVEKNKSILQQIENEVKEAETRKEPENLIAWLNQIEDKIKDLKVKTSIIEKSTEVPKYTEEMRNQISIIKEELEKQKAMIEDISGLQLPQESLAQGTSEKKAEELEMGSIKSLLATLEDQYREGAISEKTYIETKGKNLERLEQIRSEVKELESEKGHEIKTLPVSLTELKNTMKDLKGRINLNEENLKSQKEYVERSLNDVAKKIEGIKKESYVKTEELTKTLEQRISEIEKLKIIMFPLKEDVENFLKSGNEKLKEIEQAIYSKVENGLDKIRDELMTENKSQIEQTIKQFSKTLNTQSAKLNEMSSSYKEKLESIEKIIGEWGKIKGKTESQIELLKSEIDRIKGKEMSFNELISTLKLHREMISEIRETLPTKIRGLEEKIKKLSKKSEYSRPVILE